MYLEPDRLHVILVTQPFEQISFLLKKIYESAASRSDSPTKMARGMHVEASYRCRITISLEEGQSNLTLKSDVVFKAFLLPIILATRLLWHYFYLNYQGIFLARQKRLKKQLKTFLSRPTLRQHNYNLLRGSETVKLSEHFRLTPILFVSRFLSTKAMPEDLKHDLKL